jgi:hypothetical protein
MANLYAIYQQPPTQQRLTTTRLTSVAAGQDHPGLRGYEVTTVM